METCENCRFFAKNNNEELITWGQGFCYRYPPKTFNYHYNDNCREPYFTFRRPETLLTDFCGEWKETN